MSVAYVGALSDSGALQVGVIDVGALSVGIDVDTRSVGGALVGIDVAALSVGGALVGIDVDALSVGDVFVIIDVVALSVGVDDIGEAYWFKPAGFLDDAVVVDSVVFIVTGDTVKISFENLC